jgi:hypothetical protein
MKPIDPTGARQMMRLSLLFLAGCCVAAGWVLYEAVTR